MITVTLPKSDSRNIHLKIKCEGERVTIVPGPGETFNIKNGGILTKNFTTLTWVKRKWWQIWKKPFYWVEVLEGE